MSSIGTVGALTAWYTLLSEYNENKKKGVKWRFHDSKHHRLKL